MSKTIFSSLVAMLLINIASAQKNFNVTVKISSDIISKNIRFNYYDGKNIIALPDTFDSKKVLVLKGKYYGQLVSFNINYTDTAKKYYNNDVFLTEKPALISLGYKQNDDGKLPYVAIKNATPIFDTIANRSWAKMTVFLNAPVMAESNKAFNDFLKRNKDMIRNDSLSQLGELYKPYLNRAMLFYKDHPDDYFSFWHFTYQVAQPNSILRNDTAFLKKQLAFFKTVFPAKYTASIEGKELIKAFEKRIYPLKVNELAPPFSFITIDGKKFSLNEIKGKYILLDFWATWCAPCMAEMPFIKDIRKKYPADKLVIIGISKDTDLKKLTEGVKKGNINWLQFHDQNNDMSKLYEVDAIPALVLIDREGKIIYKSDMIKNDRDELPKILERLN
jgi:thiol-disulfide isomerase/thioredoxin